MKLRKNKIKIVNKNWNLMKNSTSNQNINISNNFNGIKIIYKNKSKNSKTTNNNKNIIIYRKQNLKNKIINKLKK